MNLEPVLKAKGFCDLNVPVELDFASGKLKYESRVADLVLRAAQLGYQTVALNVQIHQDDLTTKKAKSKKHNQQQQNKKKKTEGSGDEEEPVLLLDFPAPPEFKLSESDRAKADRLSVLTRLTVTFKDNNFLPIFNKSKTVPAYDLFALSPTSTNALQNILKTGLRADIICFDQESTKDVKWTRKMYGECVEKHLYFEISYAPCIRDCTARRRIIALAHNYHSVGKSKHIIISSSAETAIELRGPYDVSNLGFLFGLNEHQGKQSVSQEALNLIKAAAGRKVGPYRATVQKVDKLSESERWKLPTAGEKETRAGSKREAVSDEDSEEEEEDGEEMEEAESSCEEDRNENDGFQDVMQ